MGPAVADRPPRCPATTAAARHATRACATRPIRRPSKRSSPSCVAPAKTRALIVVLWRAGLCISEALALAESDLDIA